MESEARPRKLLAILYADIAGFSRLTDEDEDGTHRSVRDSLALFAHTIEGHGGRVVHYAGDAVLARFEAVVDALATALDVQGELRERNTVRPAGRQVQFRVGVNLGDVIEDGNEIYGHGVNVAARLESMAEAGGICVSDAVRAACGRTLPIAFEYLGERQAKNIAEPLRAYRVVAACVAAGAAPPPPAPEPTRPSSGVAGSARPPAIVVLPFLDLTGDSAHVCLADGITEDLITELSRFRSLTVIARTSAFAFKGRALNVREIAAALGVDYVLEGSIRAMGQRMRVTAQLIECVHGGHLWANRRDGGIEDIFELQDAFIAEIVGALEHRIVESRLRDVVRVPIQSLEAYDCWLRGLRLLREWSADADREAIALFERARSIEPGFARPYAGLASIYSSTCLIEPGSTRVERDLRAAVSNARRAVELDPYDASVHCSIGWVHMVNRDFGAARRAIEHGAELNPNDADVAISRALVIAYLGEPERALGIASGAVERNPLHPEYYVGYRAIICWLAGRDEQCIELFESMTALRPPDFWAWYAAAQWHLGRHAAARHAGERFAAEYARVWAGPPPHGPADYVTWLFAITPLARDADGERLLRGLAGAGLPAPAPTLAGGWRLTASA